MFEDFFFFFYKNKKEKKCCVPLYLPSTYIFKIIIFTYFIFDLETNEINFFLKLLFYFTLL